MRLGARLERWKPEFLLPVMISSKRTPKLKTSDLIEYSPSIAYSGAIYPLSKEEGMKSKLGMARAKHIAW